MRIQAKTSTQQRLILAPHVTLALKVLHMPTMELQVFLRQQVEDNPLLEVDEPPSEPTEQPPGESDSAEGAEQSGEFNEDWVAHWEQAGNSGSPNEAEENGRRTIEPRFVSSSSLHDSLLMQLGCQSVPAEERRIGEALIHRVEESGYLDASVEEVAAELGVAADLVEEVLRLIQRFDPPGVAARDLRECLLLQLELEPQEQPDPRGWTELAFRILHDHFPLFVQQRLSTLAKVTGSPLEAVADACDRLKRLNPKPGRAFSGDLPPSVIPDLLIRYHEDRYDVELNDEELPHLTLSRTYYRMLRDPRTPTEAKEFLVKKFRQAGWVIKAIAERNATLLSIGRCLISLQREFVEHGPKALKPLTQTQVAQLIGRHPSTVSRAIAGKTIDSPYGMFRLEELFASGVPQAASAAHLSDATIKAEIQRLVAEEDVRRPLSDEVLAQRLAQRSILVARRTIAKYRTSLKILPTHLRRRR